MNTTTQTPKAPMNPTRKAALAAGLFYVGTFVFSIPALGLYDSVLHDQNFVLGAGSDQGVLWGGLIEILTGLTCIGTVAALSVYTLRQDFAGGADTTSLTTTASALVAIKDWTFLLGPGIMAAVNALCFATILHRSRLVPRWIPTPGLIGAPLLTIPSAATLFGAWDQVTPISFVLALPIAIWELSVGVYMIVKGFKTPPVTASDQPVVPTPSGTLTHA